jgi:hypothetical protein
MPLAPAAAAARQSHGERRRQNKESFAGHIRASSHQPCGRPTTIGRNCGRGHTTSNFLVKINRQNADTAKLPSLLADHLSRSGRQKYFATEDTEFTEKWV